MKGSFASHAALIAGLALAGAAHAQVSEEPTSPSISPPVPVAEGAPPSAYGWIGTWFSNHYAGGYGGALKALNRDNSLWDDGFALRFDASGGRYTYTNRPGFVDKDIGVVDADAMLGYRDNTDSGNFGGYVGVSYIDHKNSDPAAPIRGSKLGAAFIGEYSDIINKNVEVVLQGRYATPFSTYSAAGRVLYKVNDDIWLGPQVTFYGNDAPYKEITVGPFVKFNTRMGEFGVSGGYRHPFDSHGADGYFASVYLAAPLR